MLRLAKTILASAALASAQKGFDSVGDNESKPHDLSRRDVAVWKEAIAAADTLQSNDKQCVVDDPKEFLTNLDMPVRVSTKYDETTIYYNFFFEDGTLVSLSKDQLQDALKISCIRQQPGHFYTKAPLNPLVDFDLTEDQELEATKMFKRFDKDQSGTVTNGGAYAALVALGVDLPEDVLEYATHWGTNPDKPSGTNPDTPPTTSQSVDLESFIQSYAFCLYIEEAWTAFQGMDLNKDGKIEDSELEALLEKTGLTKEISDHIIKNYDTDVDGYISFKEYLTMINKERDNDNMNKTTPAPASGDTALTEDENYQLISVFKRFDENHDAELDREEWRSLTHQLYFSLYESANMDIMKPRFLALLSPRSLQANNNPNKKQSVDADNNNGLKKAIYTLMGKADQDYDGKVTVEEFISTCQSLKEDASKDDWAKFLDTISSTQPTNCESFASCDSCTDFKNAYMCGWLTEQTRKPMDDVLGSKPVDLPDYYYSNSGAGKCVYMSKDAKQAISEQHMSLTMLSSQCGNKAKYPEKPFGSNLRKQN